MMFYKLKTIDNNQAILFIPESFDKEFNLNRKKDLQINVGVKKCEIKIKVDPDLAEDVLLLSKDILKTLSIPQDLLYQVNVEEDIINIGPIVGLLFESTKSDLAEKIRDSFTNYTLNYPQNKGLLYVFSKEGIDFSNDLIDGYYYWGNDEAGNPIWKAGTFPIAGAIFRRISLANKMRKKLQQKTDNKMFNSCYFNKWEFYNIVNKHNEVLDHIPETRILNSFSDVEEMIAKYDSVYLKPSSGTYGYGVIKVTKGVDTYYFQSKQASKPTEYNKDKALQYIRELIDKNKYLIQESISLLRFEKRPVDFRVIMQKDENGNWKHTTSLAFLGRKKGVCSKDRSEGYSLLFEELFLKFTSLSKKEIYKIKEKVISVCKKVGNILDESGGNYGDLGFDIGIDKSFKPWVIEVNKRHTHQIPLRVNDYFSYYNVKSNPIKYAVFLSGF